MEIQIEIAEDFNTEMAKVSINNNVVMEGNFWDFHNGCHGINEYGIFNSRNELIERIKETKISEGNTVSISRIKYQWGG